MKEYLLNLMLLSVISLPLKADEISSSNSWKYHHSITEEQKNMIFECRADYLENEIIISQRMRKLRKNMNDCMRQNNSDHTDYLKGRETLEELKVLRKKVRAEYMKEMKYFHNL